MSVGVGMIVGAGIFRSSSLVAANLDGATSLLAAWSIGGVLSFIGALCFAELAAAFPHAGGDYYFLYRAYGKRVAFLFAWSRFAVIHSGSVAMLAFVFGDYLNAVFHFGPLGTPLFAALAIVALALVNLHSITSSARTQLVLISLVVCGLAAVAVAGLWVAWHGVSPAKPLQPKLHGSAAFGAAMVYVLLAYGGWSDAATLSAEMRDSRRGIVKALLFTIVTVAFLYLAATWGFWRVLGYQGLAESSAPAAEVMRIAFGPGGELLMVVVVAITAITVMNAIMIAGARTIYATATHLPALRRLRTWHVEKGVPVGATLLQGAVALVLVGFGSMSRSGFATMVDYLSPVYWLFLSLSAFSVIVLRWRCAEVIRPFRVPLYPWLPLLFFATSLYVLYSSLVYVKAGAVAGVAVLAAGALLLLPLETYARYSEPDQV